MCGTLAIGSPHSPHTARNAGYRLQAFAKWLDTEYHITELEQVTVQHILSYKQHLAKSKLAPTSQARVLSWRFARTLNFLESSPVILRSRFPTERRGLWIVKLRRSYLN